MQPIQYNLIYPYTIYTLLSCYTIYTNTIHTIYDIIQHRIYTRSTSLSISFISILKKSLHILIHTTVSVLILLIMILSMQLLSILILSIDQWYQPQNVPILPLYTYTYTYVSSSRIHNHHNV